MASIYDEAQTALAEKLATQQRIADKLRKDQASCEAYKQQLQQLITDYEGRVAVLEGAGQELQEGITQLAALRDRVAAHDGPLSPEEQNVLRSELDGARALGSSAAASALSLEATEAQGSAAPVAAAANGIRANGVAPANVGCAAAITKKGEMERYVPRSVRLSCQSDGSGPAPPTAAASAAGASGDDEAMQRSRQQPPCETLPPVAPPGCLPTRGAGPPPGFAKRDDDGGAGAGRDDGDDGVSLCLPPGLFPVERAAERRPGQQEHQQPRAGKGGPPPGFDGWGAGERRGEPNPPTAVAAMPRRGSCMREWDLGKEQTEEEGHRPGRSAFRSEQQYSVQQTSATGRAWEEEEEGNARRQQRRWGGSGGAGGGVVSSSGAGKSDDPPPGIDTSEASFPSLGGARPPGGAVGRGAWGQASSRGAVASNIAAKLRGHAEGVPGFGGRASNGRQLHQEEAAAVPHGPQPGPSNPLQDDIAVWEISMGLRVPGDMTPDVDRRRQMAAKRDFQSWEEVRGRGQVNMAEGLELFTCVLTLEEQQLMQRRIEHWSALGGQGQLTGRTFSAPSRHMKGKGRRTLQFGCCYNYAPDSKGRPKGIVPEEVVEPMPPELIALTARLVRWRVLPADKEPDSAIVNIYNVDDCIPPHVDHFDFLRPFCTLSLLSEQPIIFAQNIKPNGPGVFVPSADFRILLPTGSCLVLKGNGGDLAQHCVPPVKARRMSITLRRMQHCFARECERQAERMEREEYY